MKKITRLKFTRKFSYFIVIILALFLFGCIANPFDTSPANPATIVCNPPYIRVGSGCCLDANNNKICDNDETANNQQEGPTQNNVLTCSGSPSDYCEGSVRKYDPECKSGQWIYKSEDCEHGCLNGACTSPRCPSICNDQNPCTQDYCSSETNYVCKYEPLNGAQNSCSGNAGNCKQYICSQGNCITEDIIPCCGNKICENTTETYVTCPADCEAPKPVLYVEVLACQTSFDILHGLGEVTNTYVEVYNLGNADATNLYIIGQASDEEQVHPNKNINAGTLKAGYKRAFKVTMDTKSGVATEVTVNASSSNGGYTTVGISDCSEKDPVLINTLNSLLDKGAELISKADILKII